MENDMDRYFIYGNYYVPDRQNTTRFVLYCGIIRTKIAYVHIRMNRPIDRIEAIRNKEHLS